MTGISEGAMNDKQLQCMYKSFHGTPGFASYGKNFMEGKGIFKEAFDRYPMQNNREGNDARGASGATEMLELRELLHCRPGKYFMIFFIFRAPCDDAHTLGCLLL